MHSIGMQTMPRISALILGLSLAAGCSKSSPDTAPPDRGEEYDVETVETAEPRPMRVTGVYLDPALTAVCELDGSDELLEYDVEAQDAAVQQTLRRVAACVKTGPLQGRRIELVGHARASGDEFRERFQKSRADAVRELLLAGGISEGDIVTHAAAPEDDPEAASEWPSERRVDIRVATRHAH